MAASGWVALGSLFALLWPPQVALAAGPERIELSDVTFVVERWTAAEGLPVNSLKDILQTRDGYLWISTFDGLVRFDGVRFELFDNVRVPQLGSNRVIGLSEDGEGALWIHTESHLTRMVNGVFEQVASSEPFLRFETRIDRTGTFWVLTDIGLYGYSEGGLEPVFAEHLDGRWIWSVYLDHRGRLWVATGDGLGRAEGGLWRWYSPADGLPDGEVRSVAEEGDGTLWAATAGGLTRFDEGRGDGTFLPARRGRFLRLEETSEGLAALRCGGGLCRFEAGGREYEIQEDWGLVERPGLIHSEANGTLWVQTVDLFRNGERLLLPAIEGAPPRSTEVASFLVDDEGTVWIATQGAGLFALRPTRVRMVGRREGLSTQNVYRLHQDRAGTIWFDQHGDPTARLARVADGALSLVDCVDKLIISSIYDDPLVGLLVGTNEGLFLLPRPAQGPPSGPCVQLGDALPQTGVEDYVQAMHRTRGGRLLVGARRGGLFVSRPGDPRDGTWSFERFTEAEGLTSRNVRVIRESATSDPLANDPGASDPGAPSTIWLGTNGGGVIRFRPEGPGEHFTAVTQADGLPSDLVRSIHLGEDGVLWVATEDRGLARLDPRSLDAATGPEVVTLDTRQGLCDNSLHQILADDAGRFWISSNRGIFRVERAQLEAFARGEISTVDCVEYTERDGLLNREANGGFQDAGIRAQDGTLWFATQNGVAVVDPESVVGGQLPVPPVYVEALLVGEDRRPVLAEALELAAAERSFTLTYTALSFRSPDQVRFRYRLGGYDEDWQAVTAERRVRYTKVPPGNYLFELQGRSSEGVWNRRGDRLAITVRPFFWETRPFRASVGLLAVGLAFLLLQQRERRQRLRRDRLQGMVRERTRELEREKETVARQNRELTRLDQAKSELFANISHEFRTPLTLSLGPLEDLRSGLFGALEPPVLREVERIQGNTARVLELVNQLLDTARLEAGRLDLNAMRQDLGAFLRQVGERFVPMAERRKIAYEVAPGEQPLWIYFDSEQLDKVISNLLANAFKFTPAGGRVRLVAEESTQVDDEGRNWATVSVADTGHGIAPEQLPRIFERFYQVDSSAMRRQPGTGLGLTLARSLVDLHGGSLEVDSVPGVGSTFTVRLLQGRDHLTDEQLATPTPRVVEEGLAAAEQIAALSASLVEIAEVEAESGAGDRESEAGDQMTVLVVDDHPDLRAYLRRHLADRYRVLEARDGAEGLALAREALPDLVISDVMMPRMDGYELTRAIKQDPELEFIPVILLTARAGMASKLDGLGEGADDYLTKPFDSRELLARIDNLIASRQRLRGLLSAANRPPSPTEVGAAPPLNAPPGHSALTGEKTRSADHGLLARVQATIDAHLGEEDFQVDALAEGLAMSRSLLYLRLQELTSKTPARLILERRLERAADLLADGQHAVGEVAYAVGFRSLSHFSQRFRAEHGVTPSQFRLKRLSPGG